ncbi:hypothetical protein LTR53_020169, partial [Teratosphaeriaceae sp. CCFEE 6253]
PNSPAANAQSWLQRLMFGVKGTGAKQKEPSKGFEVVRSSRTPMRQGMQQPGGEEAMEMQTSPRMHDGEEPYRDSPPMRQDEMQAAGGAQERSISPVGSDDED